MEKEEIISVREALDHCYAPEIMRPRSRRKIIVCFNCKQQIETIKVKEGKGLCPLCGVVLFDWQRGPREKFEALKRAFLAYKEGEYTMETLLHFFAGFCGYAPTSEDELKIKEES